MTEVVSFIDYQPPARFDSIPWTDVLIQEATAIDGTYAQIDDIALSPVDSDPTEPQLRSFTTPNGTAAELWYRVQFSDGSGNVSMFTAPIQNKPGPVYTTVAELSRVLKIKTPTLAQQKAMERVINAAAYEINSEIDLADGTTLDGWQLDICSSVNLDRAADLWRHTESAPGVMSIIDEGMASTPGRYSFGRYVIRLSRVKDQWGVA